MKITKNTIKILVLTLIIIANISCNKRKDMAPADQDLVGTWFNSESGSSTEIQLKANGTGYSHFSEGGSYENYDGKFQIENETIVFKVLGTKKTHTIDKRPYYGKIDNVERMLIDIDGSVFYLKN